MRHVQGPARALSLLGSEHGGESPSGYESRTSDRSCSHRGRGGASAITYPDLSVSNLPQHLPLVNQNLEARGKEGWGCGSQKSGSAGTEKCGEWTGPRSRWPYQAAPEQQPAAARSALDSRLASVGEEARSTGVFREPAPPGTIGSMSFTSASAPQVPCGHAQARPGPHCATLSCATAEEQ